MLEVMKRVFITGAAGFIGFHLAKHLHERGDQVIGYDNFNSYYDPNLKRLRASLLNNIGIKVIEGDICDKNSLNDAVVSFGATHIAHLAAQAGVRHSLENPKAYIAANIDGFLNVLEICRANPHIPLVYASSSSVYGLNDKIPFSAQDRTDRQASLYGVTKKSNELMAFTYHHLFGIKVTGLRFFTVYGPFGRPDMAYFSFADKILRDETIDVFNSGKMERDFTYIDDIVDGVTAALRLSADCEIFNLGNNHPEPLGYLIELLEKSLGKKAKKRLLPMQAGDVVSTFADITLSQEKLGYTPKTPLNVGIPRFIEWYRAYIDESCRVNTF